MNNADFRIAMEQWACTGCSQLLGTIPSGSGICRAVDDSQSKYCLAYVSTGAGSFKRAGESGNWYASFFQLAKTEAKITGSCVYEYSRLNQVTPVLDCHLLPQPLVQAIYEDRNLPLSSFDKSHIVIEVVKGQLPESSWSGVYFPTRRGDGGILMFDRNLVAVTTVFTGYQVPTPDEIRE